MLNVWTSAAINGSRCSMDRGDQWIAVFNGSR